MPQQIKNNDDLVEKISELKLNRTGLSWDERDRGWKKLFDMAKDDHVMLEKIQMLNNFIYSKIPFAITVPSWAKEGIDYMIIPNGTVYYSMDETKISKFKNKPNFVARRGRKVFLICIVSVIACILSISNLNPPNIESYNRNSN